MSVILETLAFSQFSLDKIERPASDLDILFLDESIKGLVIFIKSKN